MTITITAPATNPGACGSGESTYTSQFTGTDSGGQCAQSGPIDLVGSVETCTGSYNNNPIATAIVNPGVQGPNGPTCNIPAQEGWNVSANSITISNGATTIGNTYQANRSPSGLRLFQKESKMGKRRGPSRIRQADIGS